MLAVVQHEQERAIAQRVEHDVPGRSLWALPDTKDGRDRLRHQVGHRQRRQIDQPHAVGKYLHEVRRQSYRQPCLANPSRAGQRQQPR